MVRDRARRRLGLELLFVLIPYLLAVTHFAMWWGGTSAPGRFFVPILLPDDDSMRGGLDARSAIAPRG